MSFRKSCSKIYFPPGQQIEILSRHNEIFYLEVTSGIHSELVEQVCNTQVKKVFDINNLHAKFNYAGESVICRTINQMGYKVKGHMASCEVCKLAKAKNKELQKFTDSQSTIPGDRVYMDMTSPF